MSVGFFASLPRLFAAERVIESFASPLNATLGGVPFCSAFADVDKAFGSLGDALEPTVLAEAVAAATSSVVIQATA